MNHQRFIEHQQDCSRFFSWYPTKLIEEYRRVPVFVMPGIVRPHFPEGEDITDEWNRLWSEDMELLLPFERMKIHTLAIEGKCFESWLCLHSKPGSMDTWRHTFNIGTHPPLVAHTPFEFEGPVPIEPGDYSRTAYNGCTIRETYAFRVIDSQRESGMLKHSRSERDIANEETCGILTEMQISNAQNIVQLLLSFMWNITHSDNVVLRQEPHAPSKSVEWRLARTTYTIINRHAATAMQRGASHAEVQEIIKRAAGDRSAHWRTYRSPRYKIMQGQRQWIRKTWVGPREWKDHKGEHIYSITNL